MTWLIFALGAVLAVAGAISIASGISYMPVEWGWTEVIAGAVAVSGGVITLALGAILLRLGALQKAIHRGVYALSANLPDDRSAMAPYIADYPGVPPDPQQHLAPEEQHASPFGLEPGSDAVQVAPESVEAPEREVEPGMKEASEPLAEPPPAVKEDGADPEPQIEAEAASRLPWAKLRARFLKPQERLAELSRPELETLPEAMSMPLSEEPVPELAGPIDPEVEPPAPSRVSLPEGLQAQELRDDASGAGVLDKVDSSRPEADGSFRRVGIGDISTGPTIVGRYEAGGASYVLLSDGAIEVETETGTHRFASMQDLKAFIEAQQQQRSAP